MDPTARKAIFLSSHLNGNFPGESSVQSFSGIKHLRSWFWGRIISRFTPEELSSSKPAKLAEGLGSKRLPYAIAIRPKNLVPPLLKIRIRLMLLDSRLTKPSSKPCPNQFINPSLAHHTHVLRSKRASSGIRDPSECSAVFSSTPY